MKVLLATDCSDNSVAAAEWIKQWKTDHQVDLTIVTALGDPAILNPDNMDNWFPEILLHERTRTEQHQSQLRSLLQDRCQSINTIARSGHPIKVILATAEDLNVDLIVIGAKGHSAIGRLLIGSVSDSVATQAKSSVLIIRPPGQSAPDAGKDAPNLVIGYDGSSAADHAVEEVMSLSWQTPPQVTLVCVAPIYDYLLGTGLSTDALINEEKIYEAMKQRAEETVEKVKTKWPTVTSKIVHDSRIGPAIIDAAEQADADVIVVGDSNHSTLDEILLGSTSKYVLRHAKHSVWIARK